MTTAEHVLRRIAHECIRSKDPHPVGLEEIYAAITAEVTFDSDDLTPPTLRGEKIDEPSWRRNVRNSLQADKNSCILVNHTKGTWRLPTPLPIDEELNPESSWRLLGDAARLALETGQVFTSHKLEKRYRVLEVTPSYVEIGREQEGDSTRLGEDETKRSIQRFNAAGGRAGTRALNYTVAKEVILVAMHPRLGWSEDGAWIELVQGDQDNRGNLSSSWRDEVYRFVFSRWSSGDTFELGELYAHEDHFKELFPSNFHVRDKLREQLQFLRDEGLIKFLERGRYRILGSQAGGYVQLLHEVAKKAEDEGYFNPDAEDERERRMRSIVCRQGQPVFRRELIEAYEGRCAVTGYDSEMALEAAHIKPYSGPESNHVKNGLLLRADIHTLFDLDLVGVDPETLEVVLSDQLLNTLYSELAGKRLFLPEDSAKHPSARALERRWLEFQDSTGAKKAVGETEDSGDGFWNALLFTPDRDSDVAIEKEEKFKKLSSRFHRAGLGESFERLISTGERLNLYRRLNKNSVMHTPRGNKSLCAYTVKISGKSLFVAHGAATLDEYFGVPESESREWGEGAWERLDAAQVEEYCSWLEAAARPEDESGGKAD